LALKIRSDFIEVSMQSYNPYPQVLIVDDHPVVRDGIRNILRSKYAEAYFVECDSGEEAVKAAKAKSFDVAFVDVAMPGKDGMETLSELVEHNPKMPVIVLSVFREETYAVKALQLGAAAYLEKGRARETLLQATEDVLAGKRFVSPDVEEHLLTRLNDKKKATGIDLLSPKEHSIFLRLASGKSLKEIAIELGLSPKTVTTYRARILAKLRLDSNAAIAKFAFHNGLLE
jgi:DNA-binding NarL/FixJ family response regulator